MLITNERLWEMEKFLDKLSSYNLLNNLLPGAVSCFLMKLYWDKNILSSDVKEYIYILFYWSCH